jgi:Vault protein inter-alpha-trypsin domain/FecR protein
VEADESRDKFAFWKSLAPTTKRRVQLGVFAVVAVTSCVAIGYRAGDRAHSPDAAGQRAWHGKITRVARAGADKNGGLTLKKGKTESPGAEGSDVSEGTEIVTDARTRARIELDDGSSMVLDRGTQVAIESGPRTMRVKAGSIVADVAHLENAPIARLTTEHGEVGVLGTKFALTSAEDRTTVEVMRGVVELRDSSSNHVQVGAGQEGIAAKNAKLEIAPVNDLAQRLAFGERLGAVSVGGGVGGAHNEDTDLPVSGLGELRARRPGKTDEKDHAVALSSHNVKVRIVGNVARTEVDEIFTNETDDELEGVYRFPLPPDAQIERLALEVDGKLIEGSFVDKAKGAAIFRGAIQNAIPKAPKPKEEIIWVPGPWHDPALLEWQRGGRFELRIFPIPKRGARRLVIAYTETVAPVAGTRRYVYPLPQSTSSEMKIGSFGVDVQVLGADPKLGVKAKGYEVAKAAAGESGGERFAQTMTNFVPSGDLTIEYALADRATDVTAWGYTDPRPGAQAGSEKGYVALALRPKLPGWTESKPRDVVIVVDSGRAMFGERYQRAKRLAVQVTQEMDRRDRVAVLACDVTCRAMPGGFDGAGSRRAHDVDGFLAGTEPDGATDLVGAVRAATGLGGHDRTRDLRVVLVSDGIASAGYRRPERLSSEIRDVLLSGGRGRDEVIAVPIGADADVLTLKEIARGGGGVVVPYSPGEMLETAALEVLNATYGITLRDVELTLPAGLGDVAPGTIAPIRAGGEAIVTARLTGASVRGDAILRGKVGDQPFEARYPIDVQATTEAGNAFVPRLYAAARIADKERETTDTSRAELVTLSQRYAVPSRFTSLLVLESEAMFTAFGIDRSARSPSWTGEETAHGSEVATLARDEEESSGALGGDLSKDKKADDSSEPRKRPSLDSMDPFQDSVGGATGSGAGGGGFGKSASGPMQPSSPPMVTTPSNKPSPTSSAASPPPPPADARPESAQVARRPDARGGRFMKRVWFRKAALTSGAPPAVASDKVAIARAAVQAAPDERAKYKELVRMLSANGALDELGEVLARWASRDPLDPDAIAARADLSARSGDRERSLRILDGIASGAASASNDVSVIEGLALAHERAGDRFAACAFRIAAAEVRADVPASSASAFGAADVDRFARAVACERADGRPAAADRWLASRKDKTSVETAALKFDSLAKGAAAPNENTGFGDIVVDATWESGQDVDVAVVDPAGNRLGWSTRSKNVRVTDATSKRHEALAVSSGSAGAFTIELARAGSGGAATAPVTGTLSVRSFGERISVPFVLSGPVVQAARVQVRFESELVPADGPPSLGGQAPPFDRGAAVRALASVSVTGCSTGSGPTGEGVVRVTFGPTGRVISANVVDAPFVGTSTGACIAGAYRRAMVPAFDGNQGSVTLQKGFVVPP